MAVALPAYRRPYYLEPVLNSWAAADGIGDMRFLLIALAMSPRYQEQLELIEYMRERIACPIKVVRQSPAAEKNNPSRAFGELAHEAFTDPEVGFLVVGEEDVQVSSDVLTYMTWAEATFRDDPQVLTVLAHSKNGQGWDLPLLAADHNADQETVRLRRYFNPWCWGTWRDRWETILEREWDWEINSGGPMNSGYDWNVQQRILPSHKMKSVVPDASRSQNIGREEGWASKPETFALVEAFSFRERRTNPAYRLEK
jgi:hypothetical protein